MVRIDCAYDELVPIDKLKPHPRNPNMHPEKQIEALAEAIKLFGWRVPITVSAKSGVIVRGHARLEAAKRLGLEAVPVDYQDYPDEYSELADLVADNRIAELSWIDTIDEQAIIADASTYVEFLERLRPPVLDSKPVIVAEKPLEDLVMIILNLAKPVADRFKVVLGELTGERLYALLLDSQRKNIEGIATSNR